MQELRMARKKTILVTAPYFPPHSGGLERYASEISQRLNKTAEWHVVVLTSGEKKEKDRVDELDGLTVHRLALDFRVSNTPFAFSWLYKVWQIIKRTNPDLINIHTPVPGIGDLAALYGGKRPIVVTYHAGSMRKGRLMPDVLIWLYEHGPLQCLLHRANKVICSSDFVRFGLLKSFCAKSSTITPGVDAELFKPAPQNRELRPTVLFVASLGAAEQHKGLAKLIDAIQIVKATIPDVQLTVVGDGDMRETYIRSAKEKGLERNAVFRGKLDGTELALEYQKAHVFVLPTSNDSFGMVITEAMATGLPVISTNIGGIPSVVDEGITGFLVAQNDAQCLAERISHVLRNPALGTALGEEARKKVVLSYSWDDRVRQYHAVLEKSLRD